MSGCSIWRAAEVTAHCLENFLHKYAVELGFSGGACIPQNPITAAEAVCVCVCACLQHTASILYQSTCHITVAMKPVFTPP